MTATNNTGRILLFRGHGLVNATIRWQTRSKYSHAALLLPDFQFVIESYPGVGVRLRKITDWRNIDIFEVPSMTPNMWVDTLDYAQFQIGKKYDWLAIIRFVDRRRMPKNDKWFCSELVFESVKFSGLNLLNRTDSWAVAPGHLAWSPYLKLERSNYVRDEKKWNWKKKHDFKPHSRTGSTSPAS